MSLALEILEQRKQARLFGKSEMHSGIAGSDYARTNWLREHKDPNPPVLSRPAEGLNLPARMAPQPFPQHIVDAHQKSQAQTKQVQDLIQRTQAGPAAPAPEPTQAELNARHAATVSSLKQVEASRTAPKMTVAPDPNWPPKAAPAGSRKMFPSLGKTACFDCPALEVLRLRAA